MLNFIYIQRGRVNAGVLLKLCEEDPELLYWVDIPGQWDQPWNHTFPSKNLSGKVQRVEIIGNPGGIKMKLDNFLNKKRSFMIFLLIFDYQK